MNNYVKMNQVIKRLEQENIKYNIVSLQNGWSAIVCEYGGRIFGPFKNKNSESIFWMSEDFNDEKKFGNLIANRNWNIGGDRYWVAPELPFFVKDKSDFFNSYITQESLDPGNYTVVQSNDYVKLSQNVEIEAYESLINKKQFLMERVIKKADNPFVNISTLNEKIEYFGFMQEIALDDTGKSDSMYLESWLLTQINPKGKLIVPFTGSKLNYVDYYEPIDQSMVAIKGNCAYIDVTGDVRYKMGFKASNVTGRSAYLGELSDGSKYLFIRNYFNNPSNIYCAAPYYAPEQYGCSLYVYNDPGSQGGFAEFENCGTTISGETGIKKSTDIIYYYFFVGSEIDLINLASEIL